MKGPGAKKHRFGHPVSASPDPEKGRDGPPPQIEEHLQAGKKIRDLASKLADNESVEAVLEILDDMDSFNYRNLRMAGTEEELISCREYAKCVEGIRARITRARKIREKIEEERKGKVFI